jgi:hypothetical protein
MTKKDLKWDPVTGTRLTAEARARDQHWHQRVRARRENAWLINRDRALNQIRIGLHRHNFDKAEATKRRALAAVLFPIRPPYVVPRMHPGGFDTKLLSPSATVWSKKRHRWMTILWDVDGRPLGVRDLHSPEVRP